MSDWRSRATPLDKAKRYSPGVAGDFTAPMSENDILQSIEPDNWRTRAAPLDISQNTLSEEVPISPQKGNAGGPARAFMYGITGGQVPFGNVITSGIGAGLAKMASPLTGDPSTFRELYDQAQADTRATQEANPGSTLAGNITGIVSTLPLGFTKALSGQVPTQGARGLVNAIPQIGNFVGRSEIAAAPGAGMLTRAAAGIGNTALRGIKGAAVAVPAAFAYGAGDAEPGARLEGGLSAARTGAAVAGSFAAGLPVAGAALGAAVPKIDDGLRDVAKLARKYNIPLSFDQISSSRALKNTQKVSQELPFSGQSKFRDNQLSAWNKALLNTVGLDADKFTKMNMDKAFLNVGKEFDDLGKGKVFVFDDTFSRNLDAIRQDAANTMTNDAISNFNNVVENIVLPNADASGNISGEKLGKVRSKINQLARKANNPDTQDLLHDLENLIVDTMTAGDDVASGAFSTTKQKYKNLIVLEPLAAKAKAGNISPALLNSRVSKIYGRSHTRGNAGEIGELAQIGYELLPDLGGSDTLQKSLYAAGGLGAAGGVVANPAVGVPAAAIAATSMAANRAAQAGLNRNQKLIDRVLTKDVLKLPPSAVRKLPKR